ncbi:hypothetical protein [Chondromyces apiculatus]|uniref:Uncharacterized protein n=1 Tax=Chondromyces apiculatus DSM 436 TaxID=1192034 RepID=A0A017THK8_9BACT|nr:hypothetical protein [Chondromyces apiculatus]EYF08768.1 Hypothetical protein CAP_2629 [Chondromyces apiculatus DSM 436]
MPDTDLFYLPGSRARGWTLVAGCVLAGWLAPGVAAADVLPPLTPECPQGSVARKDHTGTYCEPTTCDPDQGCGKEQSCRRVAMCVETERYHPLRAGAGEQLRRIARGPCEADGSCTRPAVCESTPRCVPGASATGWRSKVGCAVAPVGAVDADGCGGLALGGVLALMAAARKRRRQQDAGM